MTVLLDHIGSCLPQNAASTKGEDPITSRRGTLGVTRPAEGPDANWIDRFMETILERKYDAAREVLRSAVSQGIDKNVAEQYGKVLEDFLQQRDYVDNPKEVPCFGVCAVREMQNQTGRGLIVPGYVDWGDELWRQRPVAYIQSPSSRKAVQVCSACLVPVGTLASQLSYLGLPVPEGAEDIEVVNGAARPLPCSKGCGEVFCGEACRQWASQSSSHAVLCKGCLSHEAGAAMEALDRLAQESDQEHILLLAHHIAAALVRRMAGDDWLEVKRKFLDQFFSSPWHKLADEGDADGDTPSYRQDLLEQALGLLVQVFAGQELAAPFLDFDTLALMMGTYELVNMCISIPHPLNMQCSQTAELMEAVALGKLHELQKGVDDESDDEDEGEDDEVELDQQKDDLEDDHPNVERPQKEDVPEDHSAAAFEAVKDGSLFAHVVGTSLCEALSFMNHSCLPNARIDFDTSATPNNTSGPGLWVYSAARRPLIPGDEVQMCYVPSVIGKPVEVRQKRMEKFGFECRCRCCTTDLMLKADGDCILP